MIAVSESGGLIKSSRTAYINAKQRSLFGNEEVPDSGLRTDNIPPGDEILRGRQIPDDRGNVLSAYRPEYGILPEINSNPIGTWRSSRSAITNPEDAAVIVRDNIGEDAQETLVSIVTDETRRP